MTFSWPLTSFLRSSDAPWWPYDTAWWKLYKTSKFQKPFSQPLNGLQLNGLYGGNLLWCGYQNTLSNTWATYNILMGYQAKLCQNIFFQKIPKKDRCPYFPQKRVNLVAGITIFIFYIIQVSMKGKTVKWEIKVK